MRTRTGKKVSRFTRGVEILTGDRKRLSSKAAFGMNLLFTGLGATGFFTVIGNAQARGPNGKFEWEDVGFAGFFALVTYLQGTDVWNKTGTDYWWVAEKGSKSKKEATK